MSDSIRRVNMRVAVVNLHRGGMAHYAAMLTRSLAAADPRCAIGFFSCEDINPDLIAPHAEVRRYPVPQKLQLREARRFLAAPRVIRRLRHEMVSWVPDLIHFNSGHLWYAGMIPGLARRFPLVATVHDVLTHLGEFRPYEQLKIRPLVRHARKLCVHSESLREQALRRWSLPPDRVAVLPHGLSPPAGAGTIRAEEKPFQVLFVGRLYAYKGLDVLLRAWPAIHIGCPAARLVIAGDGNLAPWRRELEPWTAQIKVINRYLADDEVARLLAESAVVALPYLEASQSGVALTASAFGKAVVASRVGAIPEVVLHNQTGLLVEPGDALELAAAILRLLQNPDERRRLGRSAAEHGRRLFGPEAIGAHLLDLYRAVLNGAPA